jgi:hypothetical protein
VELVMFGDKTEVVGAIVFVVVLLTVIMYVF